jgi:hypothetical protein
VSSQFAAQPGCLLMGVLLEISVAGTFEFARGCGPTVSIAAESAHAAPPFSRRTPMIRSIVGDQLVKTDSARRLPNLSTSGFCSCFSSSLFVSTLEKIVPASRSDFEARFLMASGAGLFECVGGMVQFIA